MSNISCRLWGKCWGNPADPVRLVVKWAGQQVFDGPVPTSGDPIDPKQIHLYEALCTWHVGNLSPGLVPVEVAVHNGSASINNLQFNNIVPGRYVNFKTDLFPKLEKEVYYQGFPPKVNVCIYTDQEFLTLYGFPQDSPPEYAEYINQTAPEDTWVDGNFNFRMKNDSYTDGKLNSKLNGVDWYPPVQPGDVSTLPAGMYTDEEVELIREAIATGRAADLFPTIRLGGHQVPGERNFFARHGDIVSFDYLVEWNIS